jgi:SAM-dependent methyltransferase
MRCLVTELYTQVVAIIKRPSRIIILMDVGRVCRYLKYLGLIRKFGTPAWRNDDQQKFSRRIYSRYDDYLEHQKFKLQILDLAEYDIRYRSVLRERLERLDFLHRGMTVICLAARIGTEVKSFLDSGCFAIGIDLNPGKDNRYVVYGDFHDIQFPANLVDVVFTNSLDHVFEIEKVIDEIERVLKPSGFLIVEAHKGKKEGGKPGYFESFWWSEIDDIVNLFASSQFRLVNRCSFDYPWKGEQLCFVKED